MKIRRKCIQKQKKKSGISAADTFKFNLIKDNTLQSLFI